MFGNKQTTRLLFNNPSTCSLPHLPSSTLIGPDLQALTGHVPPQITWRILASLASLSIVNMVARVIPM